MTHSRWRRFLPKRALPAMPETLDVFSDAKQVLEGMRIENGKMASDAYKLLRRKNDPSLVDRLVLLALATPRAAQAQLEMDTHKGGYRNHKARLFELIDFNDLFVDTVLAFPEDKLTNFSINLHTLMNTFCMRINTLMFTDSQYDAIVHGLSREIAVYKAAQKDEGTTVKMTSRVEDAHGVDMVVCIKDGRCINIDCKTRSSYHFRLIDLRRKDVITEEERLTAELRGYAVIRRGKHADFVHTTLIRVSTRDLGEIRNFAFDDTTKITELLHSAFVTQSGNAELTVA